MINGTGAGPEAATYAVGTASCRQDDVNIGVRAPTHSLAVKNMVLVQTSMLYWSLSGCGPDLTLFTFCNEKQAATGTGGLVPSVEYSTVLYVEEPL